MKQKIQDFCIQNDFKLDMQQIDKIELYVKLLNTWNSKMNLIGFSSKEDIFAELVIDSMYLFNFLNKIDLPQSPLSLDLGAGAGIPGIPLRILWKEGNYYLVEIREKRIFFLRQALRSLKLENTFCIREKAERLSGKLSQADLIVSRAFLPLEKLLPLSKKLLGTYGKIIVMSSYSSLKLPAGWRKDNQQGYCSGTNKKRYLFLLSPSIFSS